MALRRATNLVLGVVTLLYASEDVSAQRRTSKKKSETEQTASGEARFKAKIEINDLVWTADLKAALQSAKEKKKLLFLAFVGIADVNGKLNEANVFVKKDVKKQLKKYQLVSLYTDMVPGEFYAKNVSKKQRLADATANLKWQQQHCKHIVVPHYAIVRVDKKGRIHIIASYTGRIFDVAPFLRFLRNKQTTSDPIPTVKTWEELQALTPINLSNGVKIRLGIEANKVPQWSGVLLYCLAQDYTPLSGGTGPEPFGPVYAQFTFGNEKVLAGQMKWGGRRKWAKGTYLYVRALPIARVGTYYVRVTDQRGKVLAWAKVSGTKDFFHPWMPWLDGLYNPVSPARGIALPNVDRLGPFIHVKSAKTKKGTLPTLLPSDEKPSLTIKKQGKLIIIRAKSAFTTSRPDNHFLARWWVNGKPFVPKQTDKLWSFSGYGRVSQGKELRMEFTFRPERLGVKPGDKIGLQLMHSEGQWAWCAGTSLGKGGWSRKRGENVRVSNRIEFTVPKTSGK